MSKLLEIQMQLESINEMISHFESGLVEHRDVALISSLNLEALIKERETLEAEFLKCAVVARKDVFDYRLIAEGFAKAIGLANAVSTFQSVVTQYFASIHENKARDRKNVSLEIRQATEFDYAYSYPGSVGVVLTLSNEQVLFGGTQLDQAIQVAFEAAKATTPEEISAHSVKYGIAPVKAMYDWAKSLSESNMGAQMQWRREGEVFSELAIDPSTLASLREIIEVTGEPETEEIEIDGVLVAVSHPNESASLKIGDDQTISGDLAPELTLKHFVTNEAYTAKVRRTTTITFATGVKQVDHLFLKLDKI